MIDYSKIIVIIIFSYIYNINYILLFRPVKNNFVE